MKREREKDYLDTNEDVDNPRYWNSESAYFKGLGEDGGEIVDFTVTPSGDATRQTTAPSAMASFGTGLVDAFKATLPAIASVVQQREYNKMNLSLINAGKPPLAPQQYMAMQPPTANVVFGPNDSAKKWMVYAGIGVLALVGLRAAKVI